MNMTKGARKYFTFGSGVKYNVFELDFSYLVNTSRDAGVTIHFKHNEVYSTI